MKGPVPAEQMDRLQERAVQLRDVAGARGLVNGFRNRADEASTRNCGTS